MNKVKHTVVTLVATTFFLIFGISLKSCADQKESADRVVIWTSCSEFAQYIELFNKTHKDTKAILVYKPNPAEALPPAKDELPPDIIVGSWLRTDSAMKNFKTLDYLFDRKQVSSSIFYSQLVEAGKYKHSQVLLPVSFNLPAIIFDSNNKSLINDNYTLTPDEIRSTAAEYTKRKDSGAFTRIGFTPLSNENFIYLMTKLNGVNFRDEKNEITWDETNLQKTTKLLQEWIITDNSSPQEEQDFAFKYLFMPNYRQVSSCRTLFSYITSDELFKATKNQDLNIDYRWICSNSVMPIEDSFTMMGIYKNCKNQVGASTFITWFFQSENQQQILERKNRLNLETELFGISGGFSAVRDVTEHILPIYYTQLLSNLPPAQMITVSQKLPARWDSYRSLVVEPYLYDSITLNEAQPISEYEKEWRKKVFD